MSILSRLAGATTVEKINTEQLPNASGNVSNFLGYSAPTQTASQYTQLAAMTSVGWLFSVVNRISQSIATSQWKLYRVDGDDRQEIDQHPALDLWLTQNDFITREDFLETSAQHMELVGEMWWVLVRNPNGVPKHLQVIRPDRMSPIPHRTNFIAGYQYKLGNEVFYLEPDDVIFTRNPNPLDPYRGVGVVQSMMVDIGAERAASEWMQNFFRNSAEPGGIIEFPNSLQDADFERLATRWKMQHQGVGNAHRVAILEKGKWVDRKLTQRDMQFEELRRFERDQILGAFGMPLPIMGITESVNRANAEAAHYMYAQWLVKPRLMRIKAALNSKLLKLYPDGETLMFDFVDEVPENRVELSSEGALGYEKGILTLNEARRRYGEDDYDGEGGDDLKKPAPAPTPPAPPSPDPAAEIPEEEAEPEDIIEEDGYKPRRRREAKLEANEQYTDEGNKSGNRMERGWKRRFRQEQEQLVDYLSGFEKSVGFKNVVQKLTPQDIDSYDWDWWAKYGDEVIDELAEAFALVISAEAPNMTIPEVQRRASLYAEERGSLLLRVDGDLNLAKSTRTHVNALVAKTISEGESLNTLSKELRKLPDFDASRSRTVARTETAKALGQGQKQAAQSQGRTEKRWVTQGDALVAIECQLNAAMGWIPINDVFTGGVGVDTIPEHVNCRCVVQFRDRPITEESEKGFMAEVRCPVCDRKNGENVAEGTQMRCRRCKNEWRIEL